MKSILLAAALAAGTAMAQTLTYSGSGVFVVLEAGPCTSKEVKALLVPKFIPQFRQGSATLNGKQRALCWVLSAPDEVTIIDEKGEGGMFPLGAFKVSPGA